MRKMSLKDVYIQLVGIEDSIQYNKELEEVGVVIYPFENYSLNMRRHYYLKRLLEIQLREFDRIGIP